MNQIISSQTSGDYDKIRAAIRHLSENGCDGGNLYSLARTLNLNQRQLTDLFRRWCGLSPKSFAQAVALDHAKRLLAGKASVLDTTYEVGLSSTSRLHDLFVTHEAMPPGIYRAGGAGLDMVWGLAVSPFGTALLMVTQYGLAGLAFADPGRHEAAFADMAGRWPNAGFVRDDDKIAPLAARIFAPGQWDPSRPVRVVLIGTDFQIRVWETLLRIPLGRATTYGALAKKLGRPGAARAIGTAVGRNPVSFVVPCHRVIGASGALTGYHWGITRKRAILGWESGVAVS